MGQAVVPGPVAAISGSIVINNFNISSNHVIDIGSNGSIASPRSTQRTVRVVARSINWS